ncbi:hypothetical protein KGQ27_00175 [Patescibacteria group bacterium]|nr:hypothetical protein [Patescibacteria group bacterium]MDE1946631.1 hypothetical protein [Patescibacteria group bacterium]MDE2010585.1 hypothetical protein [Patescibacteria group bacterium]MDE2233174.1 hypothetical protein [Patescibacteria group bacterium]
MPQTIQGKKRLVLLDAHAILHRAYHALPDFATKKGEPTGAIYGLSTMLIKIIEDLKPDYMIACYDVKGPTYRHEVYKEYKAGRKKTEDDLIAQIIRSRDIFAALGIPIYDAQGFEADDIIGTIVHQLATTSLVETAEETNNGVEIVIASGDMDTMQLIHGEDVKVYTLKKGINDTIMYDENAVRKRFGFGPELIPDYKGLRGDPSDNIPGVAGIGEKTATALITVFGGIDDIYRELESGHDEKFKKAGLTPRLLKILKESKEDAEFSKMLATIRRDAPIKFSLPDKSFKEGLDLEKINTLWRELEFRTLPQRLEKAVGISSTFAGAAPSANETPRVSRMPLATVGVSTTDKSSRTCTDLSVGKRGDGLLRGRVAELEGSHLRKASANEGEFEQAALALWLVNSNMTNPKLEDIMNFTGVKNLNEAKKVIFDELDKSGQRKIYNEIERPLAPVLRKMEQRGIKVDKNALKKLSEKYHAELEMIEKKIWDAAGGEFNINSPKQLGEFLFDKLGLKIKNGKKTAGGARSTRESELEKMRDMHPVVPMIFDYRELSKLLSTYIDAIPPLLDGNDRLHTHFIQSGAATGRMASENPNLQNIPVKSELGKAIRYAFVAERGFKLAAFDYSQMELRIAAFLSGDKKLIDIFRKGEDVHTAVAAFTFKVKPENVTPEMRRRAKVINFGIIYGMGVLALKQNLGASREDAQKFLNDYFAEFATLASYLDKIKEETARRGYTETLFGRRRYFEGINSKIPYIKAQAERMAINAPIQGTEADIIKLAMVKIDEYLECENPGGGVFPLLQVHDELIYEIREDKVETVAKEIKRIMESVVDPKNTKGIILAAHESVGDNWGELK